MTHFLNVRAVSELTAKRRLGALLALVVLSPIALVSAYTAVSSSASAAAAPQTIFGSVKPATASDPDRNAVEVGVKIRTDVPGSITAIRFYKGAGNTGVHTGSLWTSTGTKLAGVTFSAETATGWQVANLSRPVTVTPGATYVASYHTNTGHYSADTLYFAGKAAGTKNVKALQDNSARQNGVYRYGASGFPTASWKQANYYVDVVFQPGSASTTTTGKPATTTTTKAATTSTTKPPGTTTTTKAPTTTTTKPPVPPSGLVPCALKGSAEGCWAANTGVPGYTEAQILAGQSNLTKVSGNMTITQDGAVVSDVWLEGCISVKAKNVTIRNTFIHTLNRCKGGDGINAGAAIDTGQTESIAGGLKISNVTINGMNDPLDRAGISGSGWTADRVNVHGFTKDVWPNSNVTISNSYLHDLSTAAGSTHVDTFMFFGGGNITLTHSFVKANGCCVTAAIGILGTYPGHDVTIDGNYAEGGSGADIGPAGGSIVQRVRVVNNALSPTNGWGGTTFATHFDSSMPGSLWSNNYNSETMAIIGAPSP